MLCFIINENKCKEKMKTITKKKKEKRKKKRKKKNKKKTMLLTPSNQKPSPILLLAIYKYLPKTVKLQPIVNLMIR